MSYQGIRRRKAAPPARQPLPATADCPGCFGRGWLSYDGVNVWRCFTCNYIPVPAHKVVPGGLAEKACAGIRPPWKGKRRSRFLQARLKADAASRAYWASFSSG